ncbi:MAG: M23 family metallopeptidase [Magnetococcales bacterium]|nr:M23 family metallopeptidase [Magnetococcales bacterium]
MYRYLIILFSLLLGGEGESATLSFSAPLAIGRAVLLHVQDVPAGARLVGSLNGKPVPFSAEHRALLALDMEAKPGPVLLRVEVKPPQGKSELLTHTFEVVARSYQEEQLTLPKGKVELAPAAVSRAKEETAAIVATYQRRGGRVGYGEGFQLPVTGRYSGVFGSRRVLNGTPRRPHSGVDIAAPQGAPVVATAPGEVALVGQDYFFTGNTLVLDHGDGVISLYAHLERIMVESGRWVEAGTVIGTVGMTGRATGPHLHWGMMVRQDRVDPLLLPGLPQEGASP